MSVSEQHDRPSGGRTAKEDEILDYLVAGFSPTEAAAKAGRSESAVYRLMGKPTFGNRLREARAAQLRPHLEKLHSALGEAIDRLRTIMNDPTVHPSTQVRAATSIADLTIKLGEYVEVLPRLSALEMQVNGPKPEPERSDDD